MIFIAEYKRRSKTLWLEELKWVHVSIEGKGIKHDALRLLYAAFLYNVWKCINHIIFKGSIYSEGKLKNDIWRDFRYKLICPDYRMRRSPEKITQEEIWHIRITEDIPIIKKCSW